ncbi:hypothetical protein GGR21_000477 [Dysgonomonas hofstadii]|uniref:Lipoprotein n=1 Tax=Dysgonomonas hofstadii TaxID=637886 RepID=A0A840CF49_9BACT|nr:hypothetical protein [Dysgonomonas hofstadii]MBB4034590.1 hypothetical protein [Dysgonomonas hofstadii]
MKKLTQTSFSIIMVLILSLAFTQCKDAKDAAVTKFMELQVDQINKQCPLDMGNGMTMDKCEIDGSKILKTYFTVPTEMAGAIQFNDQTKATMIQALKGLAEFKQIKELEVAYTYAYYDSDKKLLGEIKITPEDYK